MLIRFGVTFLVERVFRKTPFTGFYYKSGPFFRSFDNKLTLKKSLCLSEVLCSHCDFDETNLVTVRTRVED